MKSIRVLVADDSAVARRLVTSALEHEQGITVVGTAANGRIALAKIATLEPDVLILDIEMPELDGLQVLKRLRQIKPELPVIVFSSLTTSGAETTLEALSLGADDYVTKPSRLGSRAAAIDYVRKHVAEKVRLFCRAPNTSVPPIDATRSRPVIQKTENTAIELVVFAASTGGPNALSSVLKTIPRDFPVPILIVQHMPPIFTEILARRLDRETQLLVREASEGEPLMAGHIRLAPGGQHLELRGTPTKLHLHDGPKENSCRPAADVLFRSAASTYGPSVLAVVLTGMGKDGLQGAQSIHEAGGQIIVQDRATSVVWGMPGHIEREGLSAATLPLSKISKEVIKRVEKSRARAKKSRSSR